MSNVRWGVKMGPNPRPLLARSRSEALQLLTAQDDRLVTRSDGGWETPDEPCSYTPRYADETGWIQVCVLHAQNSRHEGPGPCLEIDPWPEPLPTLSRFNRFWRTTR